MKKISLITANFGGIDNDEMAHSLQVIPQGYTIDFYKFDDINYQRRHTALMPRLEAKIPKILGFELVPDSDYYIWIDGSIQIINSEFISWMILNISDFDLLVFKHPDRSNIKEELDFCLRRIQLQDKYLFDRYGSEPIESQVTFYLSNKSFVDNNLYANGVFIYNKNLLKNSPNFLKDWFYHCARYSIQDQLSLPYVLSLNKVNFKVTSENIYKNDYFRFVGHR